MLLGWRGVCLALMEGRDPPHLSFATLTAIAMASSFLVPNAPCPSDSVTHVLSVARKENSYSCWHRVSAQFVCPDTDFVYAQERRQNV